MSTKAKAAVCVVAFVVGGVGATLVRGPSETSPSFDVAPAEAAPLVRNGFADAVQASERRIRRAERLVRAAPQSWIRKGELAGAHLQHARLTGDYDRFADAEQAVEQAFELTGGRMGPHLVRAELNYALHRFDRVARDLEMPERVARHQGDGATLAAIASLRAALAMQSGRYAEAEALSLESVARKRGYANLSRLADYHWKTGAFDEAERGFSEALALLPADAHEAKAWVHLQLGLMDLERGAYRDALAHYEEGRRAFPGWWLVDEHIAEIHAIEGRTGRAAAQYRDLVDRTGEPELMDALAELTERDESSSWQRRSRAAYEARLARFPEASYGHALGHFLEHGDAPARALELAEANAKLRPNGQAQTLLAQALLAAGRENEARDVVERVLATEWVSAETHATAAIIFASSGLPHEAREQRNLALAINPDALNELSWLR